MNEHTPRLYPTPPPPSPWSALIVAAWVLCVIAILATLTRCSRPMAAPCDPATFAAKLAECTAAVQACPPCDGDACPPCEAEDQCNAWAEERKRTCLEK